MIGLHGLATKRAAVRMVGGPSASRTVALQAVIRAEREGLPFLITADRDGQQLLAVLEPEDEQLWIGRAPHCDLALDWDEQVSRVHAQLVGVAGHWTVTDDNLSQNGTFVSGERVVGRRRLRDGDVIRVGATNLAFRAPEGSGVQTSVAGGPSLAPELTSMQRKVLVALCRPLSAGESPAVAATNRAIAEELVLSVEAVKTHMRALFAKFGVESLPQNQKRAKLAELAAQAGLVPGSGRR